MVKAHCWSLFTHSKTSAHLMILCVGASVCEGRINFTINPTHRDTQGAPLSALITVLVGIKFNLVYCLNLQFVSI